MNKIEDYFTKAGDIIVLAPKKIKYDIVSSGDRLFDLMGALPRTDETYKLLSSAGGFSAISFILAVAEKEPIEKLHASTLRIGNKEMGALDWIAQEGKLHCCHFLCGGVMRQNKGYAYDALAKEICEKYGWMLEYGHNHSKVILMKTQANHYVIETSANLNTNPQMEQFCFSNDALSYEFWRRNIFEKGGVNDC